jgi:hypothetical protein
MPCIWGQHNNSQLFCPVAILPPNAPAVVAAGGHFPGPVHVVPALVDTGATVTGIASTLAARLQMQPIGKVSVHGVGGIQAHNSHLFVVAFPFALPPGASPPPSAPAGQPPIQLQILHKLIQGCEFPGGANFEVLLGMDVISTGSLVVQGNGTFSFSF